MATAKSQPGKPYDRYKEHGGEQYTGMKVGGTHKWYYDQGEWRERKVTPDDWKIYYKTVKRRAGKAPDEAGVPVGTEYNWLIVAHQRVDKLDANSYMTCMEGRKFKVAHKRAGKGTWNASEQAQRKRVITYLEQLLQELKAADEDERLPWTVGNTERVYGLELRNLQELKAMAGQLGIGGRSKLNREQLLAAIEDKLYGAPRGKGEVVALNQTVRGERHAAAATAPRRQASRHKTVRRKAA
jgi:hypothetical protein